MLIRFEIGFGVAGGKIGGAELKEMPGSFCFFIAIQVLYGLWLVTVAIKELWKLSHRNATEQGGPPNIIAVYWILATILILILNLLAVWAIVEMLLHAYKVIIDFKMPDRAVFGGLFLLCFAVLCYILYEFLFRSLIDIFLPKAKSSLQLLRKR